MKLRHNKKRNTAFLYEVLVRHLTKSVIEQDKEKKRQIIGIIKEHFRLGTKLRSELEIYKVILSEDTCDYHTAERIIFEAKRSISLIDKEQLFEEQSKLIKVINQTLSKEAYSIFIPSYKNIASVQQIFNDQAPIKTRMLLENKLIDKLVGNKADMSQGMPTLDNLAYKTFVNKFNKQYNDSMLEEQKTLLGKYINSFSDNGLGLKLYLNEEVDRLRSLVSEAMNNQEIVANEGVLEKIKEVVKIMDDFKQQEVDQQMIEKVLKIQSLVHEI
jgi:hypothetical protein